MRRAGGRADMRCRQLQMYRAALLARLEALLGPIVSANAMELISKVKTDCNETFQVDEAGPRTKLTVLQILKTRELRKYQIRTAPHPQLPRRVILIPSRLPTLTTGNPHFAYQIFVTDGSFFT
jgi:hypothetical protein